MFLFRERDFQINICDMHLFYFLDLSTLYAGGLSYTPHEWIEWLLKFVFRQFVFFHERNMSKLIRIISGKLWDFYIYICYGYIKK